MFDEIVMQQWQQPPLAEGDARELLRDAAAEQPNFDVAGLGLRLTEEEVHAFVGPGASYYLACWHAPLAEGGQPRGFNLAAALFAGMWLPYRKLYSAAGFFIACLIGWAFAERFVFLQFLGLAQVPGWWALATALVFGVVVGRRAKHLYWIRARDAIWRVRQLRLPSEQHYRELARRGGTSVRAAVAMPLAGIVVVVGARGD